MEHPVKTAPCPLYFAAHGGQFTQLGMPILRDIEAGEAQYLPVYCDRAYDCGVCPLMHEWVEHRIAEGWSVGWECDKCLKDTWQTERDRKDIERALPGFYQAGRAPDLQEGDRNFDPDRPPLTGCTRCGWGSSFLQLVLRRVR